MTQMIGLNFLKRRSKASSRCIETSINTEQFKQHLEAFLYAATILDNNDDVVDIEFGDIGKQISLKIYLKGAV